MNCFKTSDKFFEKLKQQNILPRNNTNTHAYNNKFASAPLGQRGRDWWGMWQDGMSDECFTESVCVSDVRPSAWYNSPHTGRISIIFDDSVKNKGYLT